VIDADEVDEMKSENREAKDSVSLETAVVHAGEYDGEFHPLAPPIYQTSTFSFENAEHGASLFSGRGQGYIYSRMGNPTVEALERCVAGLEGGTNALACGSGMAAIHTTLGTLLRSGDHLVCSNSVYGPTCTLLESIFPRFGITATSVDTSDLVAVQGALNPRTKAIFVETPGNPTLVISDIAAISSLARRHQVQLVVDNTFMSPVLQRPFDLGADIVVHSLTKFLNGHADVVGGIIVTRSESQYKSLRNALNHFGGVLSPIESFLVHRGVKTLAVRMQRHSENALEIAKVLEAHPAVSWVCYPGLESHPQYDLARKQMRSGGGLISFELKGGLDAGRKLMNRVKLWCLAVSLGGVESLIQHPASMTHASMGSHARARAGITDGLVRLSVGIENPGDLISDLQNALAGIEDVPSRAC
jgi:methionine-gamma-lyase